MNDVLIFCLFLTDAALIAISAWLALCTVAGVISGRLEPLLGWGLMAIALVAGSGVVLGLSGALSRVGFFVTHVALFGMFLGLRRHCWRADLVALRGWLAELRRFLAEPGWLARSVAALLLLLVILAALAATAEPRVHDTLVYRLPRIALWLQEGRIFHFDTIDPRLNYMPWVPDLLTAWLLGATNEGWSLAALVQTFGGGLLLVATIVLARQAGLARWPALGAAALVLGLANVAVQFTTSQTDVFTAGVLAAAFALWQEALQRGRGSVMAGLGTALALGSKGTIFYAAPGLLIIVLYLMSKHRLSWTEWRRTIAGAVGGVLLLVLPAYAMNLATYGGLFGSAEAVQFHHGKPDLSLNERAEKLWLNLCSSGVQAFEPHSQPGVLREQARRLGNMLLEKLPQPEEDPFVFAQYSRHYSLHKVLTNSEPNPDVLSCGLLAVLSFIAAVSTVSWSSKGSAPRPLLLVGAAAVVIYVLFQHAVLQWHPWAFRFMAVMAPWWAVTVAAGLDALPRYARASGWGLMLVASGSIFWHITTQTPEAGWLAMTRPEPAYSAHQAWRRWSESLDPTVGPLQVALEINQPLAAFLRQRVPRSVKLMRPFSDPAVTAESIVAESKGWLIAPATQFIGREGRVWAQSLVFPVPTDSYSIVAYRPLAVGENAPPVIYRNERSGTSPKARRSLLIRVWAEELVRLQLYNPGSQDCRWIINTPKHRYQGEVAAGATVEAPVVLTQNTLAEVNVTFDCPVGDPIPSVALSPGAGQH